MNRDELVALLRKRIKQAGTQSALARELGITSAYLHDILNGNREPGENVLSALGLRRVIAYVKEDKK